MEEKNSGKRTFPEVALEGKQVWESRNLKTISNSKKNLNFKNKSCKTRKAKNNNLTEPQDWQIKV